MADRTHPDTFSDKLLDFASRTVTCKKGDIIYRPGQHPRYVYFITKGEVRMVTMNGDGKEFIQGIFKAAQYFGEPALLLNRPYLAYTIASQDTILVALNYSRFVTLIEEGTEFTMSLIRTLSNRLFYKSMMLEELANEQAEHRLFTLINYLSRDLPAGECLDVTRQALADMSGLRVETVIRTVKKMAAEGLIKLIRGKIVRSELKPRPPL